MNKLLIQTIQRIVLFKIIKCVGGTLEHVSNCFFVSLGPRWPLKEPSISVPALRLSYQVSIETRDLETFQSIEYWTSNIEYRWYWRIVIFFFFFFAENSKNLLKIPENLPKIPKIRQKFPKIFREFAENSINSQKVPKIPKKKVIQRPKYRINIVSYREKNQISYRMKKKRIAQGWWGWRISFHSDNG